MGVSGGCFDGSECFGGRDKGSGVFEGNLGRDGGEARAPGTPQSWRDESAGRESGQAGDPSGDETDITANSPIGREGEMIGLLSSATSDWPDA